MKILKYCQTVIYVLIVAPLFYLFCLTSKLQFFVERFVEVSNWSRKMIVVRTRMTLKIFFIKTWRVLFLLDASDGVNRSIIGYRFSRSWECEIARRAEGRGLLVLRRHWGLRPSREMTMTSVAVAPGSLGAPSSMLTSQMYHLQQGLSPTSGSPASGKVSWKNPLVDIRFMEPLDVMHGRACRMRDASYAGVLHNGTKPRLKSWNLIRGRLLRDAERFSRRAFLTLHFFGQLDSLSFRFFLKRGKNIDYFFKIFDKSYDDDMQHNVSDTRWRSQSGKLFFDTAFLCIII